MRGNDLIEGQKARMKPARGSDPLARVIGADLLRTTARFLLVGTGIVLAVHLLF